MNLVCNLLRSVTMDERIIRYFAYYFATLLSGYGSAAQVLAASDSMQYFWDTFGTRLEYYGKY